jgi:hypothetical protein
MRLLLDESVPRRLRKALPTHSVKSAVEMGWSGVKNGALLALAAAEFFRSGHENQENVSRSFLGDRRHIPETYKEPLIASGRDTLGFAGT